MGKLKQTILLSFCLCPLSYGSYDPTDHYEHTDFYEKKQALSVHAPFEPLRPSVGQRPMEEESCVVNTCIDWCVLSGLITRMGCITFGGYDKHMK
ncbi:MAG: hypothetical protein C0514_04320 [Candidatus Puniceispirillum sp.]|nr:hypothetical protein [Candidatus Puniceispirillum sp.]